MNATMPELKRCFESADFTNVKTVLASGNLVFDARSATENSLEKKAEAAMTKQLGHCFSTNVRSVDFLRELLLSDPFAAYPLPANGKRVVTFLRDAHKVKHALPIELEGARILAIKDRAVFTDYVPNPRGPVFMSLIEKTFGKNQTTRTWGTVQKCSSR
jgi:uncharacterized protein (DUF1697 family)